MLFNIILIIGQNSPRKLGCHIIILCKIIGGSNHEEVCPSEAFRPIISHYVRAFRK